MSHRFRYGCAKPLHDCRATSRGSDCLSVGYEFADARQPSQAQPEPKRPTPAAFIFSLNVAKLPNALPIAEPSSPDGSPPPPGPMMVQNMEWLRCPPPLLRTAVLIFSGTMEQLLASNSSTV